ncbi:MAG TPA: protein kinase, partial [Roseiflexaceae bacterium]|nr:protein kinase [Roseiflexaceae bacterium]
MNDELIGTYLGQYHLAEIIGHGGMATVYKAYQPSLDRFVAIKVLLHSRDPQFVERFKREARVIARLQHPYILTVHDSGEQRGLLYLVLQYIEMGRALTDLLDGPLAPSEALRLTSHILEGLEYAHSRGVIHRDIKPSNILMASPRWPMLADFGIAKLMNESQAFTQPGLVMGTAAYMAPELAFGRPADARTDLYALGIVLYEMVTGRVPFDADTPIAMLHQHAYEPPPPPRSINPHVPEVIEAALLRALAKDPNQRYQTAAEMLATMEHAASQLHRPASRSRVTELFQTGIAAFEAGDWDRAVERLNLLVTLDPTNEEAAEVLGAARAAKARAKDDARESMRQHHTGEPEQTPQAPIVRPRVTPLIPKLAQELDQSDKAIAAERHATTPIQEPAPAQSRATPPRLWASLIGVAILLSLATALIVRARSGPAQSSDSTAQIALANVASATQAPVVASANTPAFATQVGAAPATSAPLSASATAAPTVAASATSAPTPTRAPDALTIGKVNLRIGPSTGFPILGTYDPTTALSVTGKLADAEWLQVQVPTGQSGWMFA